MEPESQIISTSTNTNISSNIKDSILFKDTGQITSLLSMIDNIQEVIAQLEFFQLEQSEMIQVMKNLNTLFNHNRINIQLFIKYLIDSSTTSTSAASSPSNVFVAVIKRYLASEKNEDNASFRETLLTFFDFLFCNSDCGIEAYDTIYQSLSDYFFRKDTTLTESKLLDHFNLLTHLYGYPLLMKQKPKNYYFFAGDCCMEYQIDKGNEIKLINGFCITIWFKPLSEVGLEGKSANIIHLTTDNMEITLSIKRGNMLTSQVDFELPNTIALLPQNEWICLSMNISTVDRSLHFKINKMGMITNKIPKISISSEIKSLSLFENYYGEATSIVMSNQSFALQNTNNCFNKFPLGIYKRSQVALLIEGYPLDKILCLYTTIHAFDGRKYISDIIGHSQFELIKDCGVHCYHSNSKKITVFGGVNQLLPVMELIYASPALMTEQVVIAYLNLIAIVFNKCPNNIKEAEDSDFFFMFSLFFEKLPLTLFNNRLLDKFIEIKEIIIKTSLMKKYFKDILLNETILSKFPINVQSILWNNLDKMAMNDIHQFITYCPMNKMCLLLKCYDQNRYEEYCCQEHADLFVNSNGNGNGNGNDALDQAKPKVKIMNPCLMEKTLELRDLIEKIAKRIDLSKTQDPLVFFEFLAFDLSPCLIKALVKLLMDITRANENIAYIHQYKARINSILIHLLMTSLPDSKCDILSFIFIINRHSTLSPSLLQGIKSNLYITNVFNKERPKGSISNEEIEALAFHCRSKIESKSRDQALCVSFNAKEALLNLSSSEKYSLSIYNCLLQFLFNKIISNLQEEFHINPTDFMLNGDILNIIIEYCDKKNMTIKLLKDLNTVFESNKDNCLKFYSNQSFYVWLIRKMLEGYLREDKENEQLALTLKINNAIIKHAFGFYSRERNDKDPSFIFYYFYSFGIDEIKVGFNAKIMNKFIQFVVLNIFESMQVLAKRSLDDVYYQSIMVLSSSIIDFITVFNLKRKRMRNPSSNANVNTNDTLAKSNDQGIEIESKEDKKEGDNITDPFASHSEDNSKQIESLPLSPPSQQQQPHHTILPISLFEGININPAPESDRIEDIWYDYVLFEKFFSFFSQTWFQSFLKFANKDDAEYIILNNETIMENLLLNQSNKNIFALNLKELNFKKGMYTHSNNILFCFIIILTHAQSESDINKWLNEFKIFILFHLLAASNLTTADKTIDYQQTQSKVMDIIGFSIIFLTECYQTRNEKNIKELFAVIIKIIFSLCCNIQQQINISETSKTVFSIFKKNPIKDLYNTCVHRLFKEFFVDSNGYPLLSEDRLFEIQGLKYATIPDLFNNEPWKEVIEKSQMIAKRIEALFCIEVFNKKRVARFSDKVKMIKEETNETKQVIKTVRGIIDARRSDWLQFTNGSFYNIKQKQLMYKKQKKKMFQWKGMWANRKLFYDQPERLRYKIMNHLTKSFAKPFLCTILDINYYVPNFTYFSIDKLFRSIEGTNTNDNVNTNTNAIKEEDMISNTITTNTSSNSKSTDTSICNKDDLSYIKLNINNIFTSIEESALSSNDNDSNSNNNNSTLLKQIYLNYDEDLWSKYSNCNSQVFLRKEDNTFNLISGIIVKSQDDKLRQYEKEYQCCRVKLSHHVKGVLCLNKNNAIFKVSINQKLSPTENKNNIDYDDSRKTCFGSYFVFHHKDQDTITYTFPYQKIRHFFRRNYYHRNTGLELYLTDHKSFFLNFNSSQDREEVILCITEHMPRQLRHFRIQNNRTKDDYDNIVGYENMLSTSPLLPIRTRIKMKKLVEAWKNNFLSNFDMLMCLNLFSNRSYSDLSQYPVFPWIITNYSDDTISPDKDFRDLSLPMGMITLNAESIARKNLFIENYSERNSKEIADEPFYFGSHYSNPIYTTHYMTRIFPYSHIMVELQGCTFDDPNRLFLSIEGSFKSASSQKSDVRELIPEFYYLPELFININNLNLGVLANQTLVNDVKCPDWSKNDPYLFITMHREYLESDRVSNALNLWIDLIFGKKQRGKEASLAYNVFFPRSYDFNIENASKEEHLRYRAEVEFGLCPKQIFSEDFPNKTIITYSQVTRGKLAVESVLPLKKPNDKTANVLLGFRVVKEETVLTFFNNNEAIFTKLHQEPPQDPFKDLPKDSKRRKIANLLFSNKKDSSIQSHTAEEENAKRVLCLYKLKEYYSQGSRSTKPIKVKKHLRIIQGGFFDGKILITSFDPLNNNKESHIVLQNKLDSSPISAVESDDGHGLVFGGNHEGRINVFYYNLIDKKWELKLQLINHSKRVNSIFYSAYLNLIVSCSSDGYINYYTSPLLKHFRSIYIANKSLDYVFVSTSPLPSLVVISHNDNSFVSYSINGKYLTTVNEDCRIKSPLVYTDSSFKDYIIFITATTIKVRAFPYLEVVNEVTIEDKNLEWIDISENRKFFFVTDDEGNEIITIKSS